MKIAIAMSYFNRQRQLDYTLLHHSKTRAKDVELILLDDASDAEPTIHEAWMRPVMRLRTDPSEKFWTSVPAIPLNRAIQAALNTGAEFIVLQSPECYPVGDVLAHVEERCRKGVYTTFGCLSLSKADTFDPWIMERIREVGKFFARGASSDAGTGWFNHSVHRKGYLEFCAAVHRDDMLALNGYDERFAPNVACGDCDLLRRVKNLGLKREIVDDPFVVHQWHGYGDKNPYDDVQAHQRNRNLLLELEKETGHRAVHTHTEDLR